MPKTKNRFIRQRDRSSCCPVALANAMMWAGEDITGKDIPDIQRRCGRVPRKGSPVPSTYRAIVDWVASSDRVSFEVLSGRHATTRKLDPLLRAGCCAIVVCRLTGEKDVIHAFFVTGKKGRDYEVVNYFLNETISTLSSSRFRKDLERDPEVTVAYILSKKPDVSLMMNRKNLTL